MDLTSTSSFFVFDKDLNYAGTLFGGKLMAECDCEAAKVARRIAYICNADNAVTRSFSMDFIEPAHKGDLILMNASISNFGKTSIEIIVNCYRESYNEEPSYMGYAKAVFVILKNGIPFQHNMSQ